MSVWQLGSVLFSDYDVYVSGSSSVLDFPELTDEGHDWLDQDGKSYWLPYTSLKKSNRDLIVNCWILASGYSAFKTNVKAFFDAVKVISPDTLITPFGNISNVALHNSIQITRHQNYVEAVQAGTFSLRLTVMGDSIYGQSIGVYNQDGSSAGTLSYDSGFTITKRLQGEAFASFTVEQNSATVYDRNCYILPEIVGSSVEKYYLDKKPEIQKKSSNKYIVTYRFEHESFRLKYIVFLYTLTNESDFYWYADLDEVIDKLVENANRYQPGLFVKGTVPSGTTYKNHKFSGESCWDVLSRMCEDYEYEYEFVYSSGVWTINIAEKITRAWPLTLQYGKGNGLYEITREAFNTEELCNVLYAFGANRNLKYDYGYSRLVCPGNPLTDATSISTFGRVEKTEYFDDVYPAFTGTVNAYEQVLTCEEGDPGWAAYEAIMEVWPGGMYKITASIGFDINENLLGMPPKLWMTSGNLKGMQFDVQKHDYLEDYIFISPIVDEHAGSFPNATAMIEAGDTFTLIDTKQDATYISTAEASLLAQAQTYLAEHKNPKITYRATVDPAYMLYVKGSYPAYAGFNVGDTVAIEDSDLAMTGPYRVSQFVLEYESKKYDLTLSESRPLTKYEAQIIRINNIAKKQDATKSNTVIGTKRSNETSEELLNRVFLTKKDYKFNAENNRSESIDPRMLAYDAGVPQFMIHGMLIETNYQGLINRIKVNSGSVDILNWEEFTLERYDLWKLEDGGGNYDPRRTWIINETIIDITTNNGYYIYLKLERLDTSTVGIVFCSEDFIRVKDDRLYLYYCLGWINAPSSKRQAALLWGHRKIYEVPEGGDTGEVLTKVTGTDHDYEWLPVYNDPRLFAGGQVYYLWQTDSDVANYKQALTTVPSGALATYSGIANNITGEVLIKEFVTDPGIPGVSVIPAGPWVFESWVYIDTGNEPYLVVRVYKRDALGNETQLFTFEENIKDLTATLHRALIVNDAFSVTAADRIVVKYLNRCTTSDNRTIYLDLEGTELSSFRMPLTVGGEDNYVDSASWDADTDTLTIGRTGTLTDIEVVIPMTGGTDTDELVKYDAGDTTAGYLADKIIAGTNITLEEGTGADENKLKISASGGSATDELVKYDAGDTTAGYVADKIVAGTGITVAEGTGANENKLEITCTVSGGASAPTTVTSETENTDNGSTHTHELDELHTTSKSATYSSVTIDKKGRVTALTSGSLSGYINKSTATSYPNAGTSGSYDIYAGPMAGTGVTNYCIKYDLGIVEDGGAVDSIVCMTAKAYDGIVYIIPIKASTTSILSVSVVNNGTSYYLRVSYTVTAKAKYHFVWSLYV